MGGPAVLGLKRKGGKSLLVVVISGLGCSRGGAWASSPVGGRLAGGTRRCMGTTLSGGPLSSEDGILSQA